MRCFEIALELCKFVLGRSKALPCRRKFALEAIDFPNLNKGKYPANNACDDNDTTYSLLCRREILSPETILKAILDRFPGLTKEKLDRMMNEA